MPQREGLPHKRDLEERDGRIGQLTGKLEKLGQEITKLHGNIHVMGVDQNASEARASQQLKDNAREISGLQQKIGEQEAALNENNSIVTQQLEEQLQTIGKMTGLLAERDGKIARLQDELRKLQASLNAAMEPAV